MPLRRSLRLKATVLPAPAIIANKTSRGKSSKLAASARAPIISVPPKSSLTTPDEEKKQEEPSQISKPFHEFTKLPTEIRFRIWRLALAHRKANQILIHVKISLRPAPSQDGSKCRFTLQTDFNDRIKWAHGVVAEDYGKFGICALSLVCFESRKLFLETFPRALSTPTGGLIRYEPKSTVIHLVNCCIIFRLTNQIAEDSKNSLWPIDILNLGIGAESAPGIHPNILRLKIHNSMPNLKNIVSITHYTLPDNYSPSAIVSEGTAQPSQNHLDELQRKVKTYQAPKYSVIDTEMIVLNVAHRFLADKMLELRL